MSLLSYTPDPEDLHVQCLRASGEEVVESVIDLEADQISPKNAILDVPPGRKNVQEIVRGARSVQEPADGDVDVHLLSPLSQHERQEHEVVVVHTDVIAVFEVRHYRVYQDLVCSAVCQHGVVVERRPCRVGSVRVARLLSPRTWSACACMNCLVGHLLEKPL